MALRVYICMPLGEAWRAKSYAVRFRDAEFEVASDWHETGDEIDPVDLASRRRIYDKNRADLASSDVVFVDATRGFARATWCEVGAAIALGKPVVWRQAPTPDGTIGGNIFDADDLVQIVTSDADVLRALHHVFDHFRAQQRESETLRAHARVFARACVAETLAPIDQWDEPGADDFEHAEESA